MNDSRPLVVANLKANHTWDQMAAWLDVVGPRAANFAGTVIICPSLAFLTSTSLKIKSANWKLLVGSQDISQFEQGAYTGEVAASQIADLCQYAIIGHSERRHHFKEDDAVLIQKVQKALKGAITPIFCIQGPETSIPQGVNLVAYEPVFAIGTGNPDTPQNAHTLSEELKAKGAYTILYGGSVSAHNAQSFLKKGLIDGLLVATHSLDPQNFVDVLAAAHY